MSGYARVRSLSILRETPVAAVSLCMRPHPIPPHKGEGRASRSRGDAPRGNAARLAPPPLSQLRGSPHPAAFASLRSASAATLPFGEGWSERRRIGFTSRSQPPHHAHSLRDAPCLVDACTLLLSLPRRGRVAERSEAGWGSEMKWRRRRVTRGAVSSIVRERRWPR